MVGRWRIKMEFQIYVLFKIIRFIVNGLYTYTYFGRIRWYNITIGWFNSLLHDLGVFRNLPLYPNYRNGIVHSLTSVLWDREHVPPVADSHFYEVVTIQIKQVALLKYIVFPMTSACFCPLHFLQEWPLIVVHFSYLITDPEYYQWFLFPAKHMQTEKQLWWDTWQVHLEGDEIPEFQLCVQDFPSISCLKPWISELPYSQYL